MASIIRIKRSEVAGNPNVLAAGELAYSGLQDNGSNGGDRLYIGMGTETSGNAANHVVIGGKWFTDQITAATNLNTASTIVKRDSSGNFAAGTITAQNLTVTSDVTIGGNLTVNGTTTTVNSTAVAITDVNLTLAKDATTSAQADGAGLTIAGAAATFTYTSSNDRWNLNKDLVVSQVIGNASTATQWATARDLSLTGDASATLSGVNGTAAVSATLTLATVNSNIGSFGTSTSVPAITVNAKGLVTAVTTNAIPTATSSVLGLASFSSDNFTVTSGAVTISAVDGGIY